jgi:lipoyl(octanoyl) transferase
MKVFDLGRMGYPSCAEYQAELLEKVASGNQENTLLLVEHDPVLTLGAGFHEDNLLLPREDYLARGMAIETTNRGGDVTYHGPGQLVIYPIFRLDLVSRDLHRWMRELESTMIAVASSFGLFASALPSRGESSPAESHGQPLTGCWIEDRKLAAIGVKVRRWTSMHGIALNCDLDLSVYDLFVPCGIRDFGVTSLSGELGRGVTIEEAKPRVVQAFRETFQIQ